MVREWNVPRLLTNPDGVDVYLQLVGEYVKATRGESRLALEHWATCFSESAGGALIALNPHRRGNREQPECLWVPEQFLGGAIKPRTLSSLVSSRPAARAS